MKNKFLPLVFICVVFFIFFRSFLFQGRLPIPSDTIIGLYHPFRDYYAKEYPNGIPFKNFLITDPVRQQYPWRNLVVTLEKKLELPLWNPYSFSGMPLLANFQSAVFYPLNFLFFIFPFYLAWSILIFLQPLMACVFLYFFLRNLKIEKLPSLFGSMTFAFSGFFIAWLEWGTVIHTALWLPLILLSIDKIFINSKLQLKNKSLLLWTLIFIFSLVSSFFAGHLQTFFYLFIFSVVFLLIRWWQYGRNKKAVLLFAICFLLFAILTSIQWAPTLQLIGFSSRSIDQSWHDPGWFIPWQNLVQFLIPDFFGNPATLNYWGVWNYGEFIGYVGLLPLMMAIFALFFRRDKKTLFFGFLFFLSLIFSLPTIFAKAPFFLKIPFISTSQPTRLLFITDFCLAVLSAVGFEHFLKNKKGIFYVLGFIGFIFVSVWAFIVIGKGFKIITFENLSIAKNNLLLPTVLFIFFFILISIYKLYPQKNKYRLFILLIIPYIMLFGLIFDLVRFGWKFTPFNPKDYLFPQTSTIKFLKEQEGLFRIMSSDSTILPPNFSVFFRLQSVDGYDPLYIQRYAELMAAYGRMKPDIHEPFGFNRIITPQNQGRIMNFLGVKYVISGKSNFPPENLEKVFSEGEITVYKNKEAFDRFFFVADTIVVKDKQSAIEAMFDTNYLLNERAIIENTNEQKLINANWSKGSVVLLKYTENKVLIKTYNKGNGFLVFTDTYYPTWHVRIDGVETKIYLTDFNFRGIIVPKGTHMIEFSDSLF
ncbi:MAG: YfhO family protein [Candidatus Levyibacteriota bacterium]